MPRGTNKRKLAEMSCSDDAWRGLPLCGDGVHGATALPMAALRGSITSMKRGLVIVEAPPGSGATSLSHLLESFDGFKRIPMGKNTFPGELQHRSVVIDNASFLPSTYLDCLHRHCTQHIVVLCGTPRTTQSMEPTRIITVDDLRADRGELQDFLKIANGCLDNPVIDDIPGFANILYETTGGFIWWIINTLKAVFSDLQTDSTSSRKTLSAEHVKNMVETGVLYRILRETRTAKNFALIGEEQYSAAASVLLGKPVREQPGNELVALSLLVKTKKDAFKTRSVIHEQMLTQLTCAGRSWKAVPESLDCLVEGLTNEAMFRNTELQDLDAINTQIGKRVLKILGRGGRYCFHANKTSIVIFGHPLGKLSIHTVLWSNRDGIGTPKRIGTGTDVILCFVDNRKRDVPMTAIRSQLVSENSDLQYIFCVELLSHGDKFMTQLCA